MKNPITINADAGLVTKEINGYVFAIRYAKGMTEDEIRASLKNNPPVRRDWKPFNTSDGCFC